VTRRRRISRPRRTDSFRRASGNKPPRSITFIICEGEAEKTYFNAARIRYGLTTAEVVLPDNTAGSAPISVVRCAEARGREPGGYDTIFCVFDRDGHESFDRARERIRTLAGRTRNPLPIREAISIPCFEFWVLLHFERTDAPFTCCDEVTRKVRNHMMNYEKANATIARSLMDNVECAMEHADWLERSAEGSNQNPDTSVHYMLRHFEQIAQRNIPHAP
jgi:hypothetical protein